MIPELVAALSLAEGAAWSAFVVFLRIGAMMALLPAFGETVVPVRVRLALGLAFTAIVWPALQSGIPLPPTDAIRLAGLVLAETGTGVFLGLVLRLFVITLQVTGTIAAQSTSLSQIFGGTAGADPLPAMGHVLLVAGLALAALLDLHVRIAEFLIFSYDLIPAGRIPSPQIVVEAGVAQIGRSFALAFSLAAPFLVASLLYNVTLGVINRAMPQLMVAFVGAPAITAGSLILLFLTAPIIVGLWSEELFRFLHSPFGSVP